MIFVTVGISKNPFYRLVKKMDEIASNLDEKVIIQLGHTNYKPKYAEYFDFRLYSIQDLFKGARVVVSHGGAGAILNALSFDKPIITVPRLKRYREHMDDHQLDIVREMEKRNKLIAVYDIEDLEEALKRVDERCIPEIEKEQKLVEALKRYIEGFEAKCR